jgi:hypothetical protein
MSEGPSCPRRPTRAAIHGAHGGAGTGSKQTGPCPQAGRPVLADVVGTMRATICPSPVPRVGVPLWRVLANRVAAGAREMAWIGLGESRSQTSSMLRLRLVLQATSPSPRRSTRHGRPWRSTRRKAASFRRPRGAGAHSTASKDRRSRQSRRPMWRASVEASLACDGTPPPRSKETARCGAVPPINAAAGPHCKATRVSG